MSAQVMVYGRPGCHLCDQMMDELGPLAAKLGLRVEYVDITGQAPLVSLYGTRIPVLEINGVVVCEARLDTDLVEAHCRARSRQHG